jgi:hypothetical protein
MQFPKLWHFTIPHGCNLQQIVSCDKANPRYIWLIILMCITDMCAYSDKGSFAFCAPASSSLQNLITGVMAWKENHVHFQVCNCR